jgi:hypothetical protein
VNINPRDQCEDTTTGYELRGGSAADHANAKHWSSMFLHEAVVKSPPALMK